MSRYIEAEWLVKESMPLSFSVQKWVNEVQIMTAPSIDIVRCGECRHMTADGKCMEFADSGIRPSATDFCSYGIRREDGEA